MNETVELKTLKQADKIHGGLSKPSKMPGYAYGIPAKYCNIGSILRQLPGSVCSKCYALKGRYVFPTVLQAQERRFQSLTHPQWVDAMVFSIRKLKCDYFRWHDSGDLQGIWHLKNIVKVALLCPETKFWLPTREVQIVDEYLKTIGDFPNNLVVRISAPYIDGELASKVFNTSTVVSNKNDATCPAYKQGGKCGSCRACWDPTVKNVSYPKH